MTAAEFVDGGRHPAHVGPSTGSSTDLSAPRDSPRSAAKAEGTPAVALSGVPLPTSLDVTDAEGRQVRERAVRCSRCGVKTWAFDARCDRCAVPSPRDDERSER